MTTRVLWVALPVAAIAAAGTIVWRFGFLMAPAWSGEADALADALGVTSGMHVADVGAGDGAVAEVLTRLVGDTGRVYATEVSADRLTDLATRKVQRRLANLEVVAARDDDTGLPGASVDALYLRHVFHHLTDRSAMVQRLARAVRPGGRIAVIDFPPGALWFHGADHGVTADTVREVFWNAGWRLRERRDAWGGGTFLVVFERGAAQVGARPGGISGDAGVP